MSISILCLKGLRKALRAVERGITRRMRPYVISTLPGDGRDAEYRAFFDKLVAQGQTDASYMNTHRERLVRTMSIVPEPWGAGRVLELGAYMQMTPVLQLIKGYREVRGGYFGKAGETNRRRVVLDGRVVFECEIDLFNAELDRFPYEDSIFEMVVCCEMIEHLLHDPMGMMLEIHRVLGEGGRVLLTTPNVVSYTGVARVLKAEQNPQLYAAYERRKDGDVGHMREYAPSELDTLVTAAGFVVEALFTDPIAGYEASQWTHSFLEDNGFDPSLRGEQMYCIARKDSTLPQERYPDFLYA